MMRLPVLLFVPLALLSACGQGKAPSAPDGVTAGETRALQDAAEMIADPRQPVPDPAPRTTPGA